jgi:flavin reductase (DIM6/NTAB) family NADH-FMN oxidoreductase RutF
MNEQAKKSALRMFTYGLYAVTARQGAEVAAMTANFLTQSAFEPPMITIAVELGSKTHRLIEAGGRFAVNVLASGQRELAGQLGRKSANVPDKLAGVAWTAGPLTGAPILAEALAWLECEVRGRLPSGDHTVFVAQVIEAGVQRENGTPLTMAETGFRHFG